ncbi:MAG: hypothetical protein HYW90_04325 [Candidatus Sungbacteria bacterium]|nr:hypothetical protein [Candidatus Sungbacteria bacterium]
MFRIAAFAVMLIGLAMVIVADYVIHEPTFLAKILVVVGTIFTLSGFSVWQLSAKLQSYVERYHGAKKINKTSPA